MLHGSYDPWLVAASLLMAILAAYTALNMTGRVTAYRGWIATCWLSGGAIAMGVGIWSMHFLGMLAFRLPIPMGYDPALTALSAIIAIAASAFALWGFCQKTLTLRLLILGSCIMGAGVCGMHFTGMAAMRMDPAIQYNLPLLVLSVVIAVVASGIALWLAFYLRSRAERPLWLQIGAATVMGCAVSGMHYTAMAAAEFRIGSVSQVAHSGLTRTWLAALIIVIALSILLIALISSILEYRFESKTANLFSSLDLAKSELEFLALHDSLTKLPNRTLLVDRLQQEMRNAIRERTLLAVLFLDLDGFKQINDAFGHSIGDQLLIQVSARILQLVRDTDTLARIGGDEFVLLARVNDPTEVAALADRIITLVQHPIAIAGHDLHISTSIGIALFSGEKPTPGDLIKNADAAMYHAKALGRNGYCFFEDFMSTDMQQKLQLLQDLRAAIQRHQLILFYQPRFNAKTRAIVGVEALIRWQHPTRGLICPAEFIPLAEKTGLIIPIGEWVMQEACRQISQWRAAGHPQWDVSVNLSAVQFNHPGLAEMVRNTLQQHQVPPDCLILEITESTAMRNVDASITILRQLVEMGVRISIDDFGIGYSNLLQLKHFPASELKIDPSFVRDLGKSSEDEAIVASIVALGVTLNLQTVGEGVETSEQLDVLTRLGCNLLQGYFLGTPRPAVEFDSEMPDAPGQPSLVLPQSGLLSN